MKYLIIPVIAGFSLLWAVVTYVLLILWYFSAQEADRYIDKMWGYRIFQWTYRELFDR